jgi:hypothetical protein
MMLVRYSHVTSLSRAYSKGSDIMPRRAIEVRLKRPLPVDDPAANISWIIGFHRLSEILTSHAESAVSYSTSPLSLSRNTLLLHWHPTRKQWSRSAAKIRQVLSRIAEDYMHRNISVDVYLAIVSLANEQHTSFRSFGHGPSGRGSRVLLTFLKPAFLIQNSS